MNHDVNGNFRNDHADFVLFKDAYETANGTGSFATMLATVPEPTVSILGTLASIIWPSRMTGRRGRLR